MQVCRSLHDKIVTNLLQATVSIPYQLQTCVQVVNKNVTRLSLGSHKVVDKIVTSLSLLHDIYTLFSGVNIIELCMCII